MEPQNNFMEPQNNFMKPLNNFIMPFKFWNTYVKQLWAEIPRAYVAFPTEGTDRDGVFVEDWQVIAEPSVHVSNSMEPRGKHAREYRHEARREKSLVCKGRLIISDA